MATINRFEDLEIWKEARRLAVVIHKLTVETNLKTDFKLKEQIKAASGSIMDNIAEGFVSNVGHWGNGSYEIKLTDLEDIDYVISLLKQSLRKNKAQS